MNRTRMDAVICYYFHNYTTITQLAFNPGQMSINLHQQNARIWTTTSSSPPKTN